MKTDNSSVPYTCPKIDEVIRFLKSIEWDESNQVEKHLCDECQSILETMEEIRNHNEELREWGNEEYKRRKKLEEEVDYLEWRIKRLQLETA